MKITNRAQKRIAQEGLPKIIMDIIMRPFLSKRERQAIVTELKRAIQMLDKAKGGNVIICDDRILTVYKN
jgi:hypothetical protein